MVVCFFFWTFNSTLSYKCITEGSFINVQSISCFPEEILDFDSNPKPGYALQAQAVPYIEVVWEKRGGKVWSFW